MIDLAKATQTETNEHKQMNTVKWHGMNSQGMWTGGWHRKTMHSLFFVVVVGKVPSEVSDSPNKSPKYVKCTALLAPGSKLLLPFAIRMSHWGLEQEHALALACRRQPEGPGCCSREIRTGKRRRPRPWAPRAACVVPLPCTTPFTRTQPFSTVSKMVLMGNKWEETRNGERCWVKAPSIAKNS